MEKEIERLKSLTSEYKVPNLIRGLAILEVLECYPKGLTCSEIAQLLGYPSNSAFRVTMALLEQGWLLRDSQTKRFTLSQKILKVGSGVTGEKNLILSLNSVLKTIRDFTGETVLLGVLAEKKCVVLDQELSNHAFKFQLELGSSCDLHASAPGKIILAMDENLKQLPSSLRLKKYTEQTITSKVALRRALETVREKGYALDDSEMIEGCHCIAIPVWNNNQKLIGAIWATGPANRFTKDKIELAIKEVPKWISLIGDRLN